MNQTKALLFGNKCGILQPLRHRGTESHNRKAETCRQLAKGPMISRISADSTATGVLPIPTFSLEAYRAPHPLSSTFPPRTLNYRASDARGFFLSFGRVCGIMIKTTARPFAPL